MSYPWQARSAAPATAPAAPGAASADAAWAGRARARAKALTLRAPHPELAAVMSLAALLNLWALSRNGWANDYYAAAVKSMSSSWHDFLFASLDKGGVMTVDKPPLALWVQALSVRAFGFHSLSMLVPQALMGVASVALVYDLVRRRFGRVGGFVAGLALALTPIAVAISRHNNPDSLLILCCVAALWCTVRALDAAPVRASTRTLKGTPPMGAHPEGHKQAGWLVAAGVCVGLGFETKMLVALVVVPGIVAAWLWVAPAARGRLHALRQLLAGGVAMLLVGGAWPLLVELTPAADRPWVSGTSNNAVLSLIFEYNGVGRVDGQAGGPPHVGAHPGGHTPVGGAGGQAGGTASNVFGGATGPLRLLNSALGGQAGWLLGFALAAGVAILATSRLRRADARSGWLLAVGGSFATTAVLFSFASGIFHPYYVSLLAPLAAALVGAGAAQLTDGGRAARVLAPLAVIVGVVVELIVRADYPGQLTWLPPVLIVVGALAVLALVAFSSRTVRVAAVAAVLAALLAAPAVWAVDTLGYATSSTFPSGGPASAESGGAGGGFPHPGTGGGPGRGFGGAGARGGFGPPGAGGGAGGTAAGSARGGFSGSSSASGPTGGPPGGAEVQAGAAPQLFGSGRGGAIGVPLGGSVSSSVLAYVKAHGGGTIAVASQSNAASAILDGDANVAGIGGFSGRESEVSVSWLAGEVRVGKIRWVLDEDSSGGFGGGPGGDTRTGAKKAMAAVARACVAVTLSGGSAKLYDCQGRAQALAAIGA